MKLKLTHDQFDAAAQKMGDVVEELGKSKHRHNQLLAAVLAEVLHRMLKQLVIIQKEYHIKLTPAQAVAVQAFCEDHLMSSPSMYHNMVAGRIMSLTHPALA